MENNLTSWQYHIIEMKANDQTAVLEIALDLMIAPIRVFSEALMAGFQAIGQAFQEAEDKQRMAQARDITPIEPAGLLGKGFEDAH